MRKSGLPSKERRAPSKTAPHRLKQQEIAGLEQQIAQATARIAQIDRQIAFGGCVVP